MGKAYERVIKQFLAAHIPAGSRIIDVGCGTGWTALFVAENKAGCRVDGVDIDTLKVHRANRLFLRAKREHLVHCARCGAEELVRRFKRRQYDVVVSCHSLHHYREPVRALRQMRGVLKREGVLLLAELTPAFGERVDDCARYSLAKIRAFFKRAGWRLREASVQGSGVILMRASLAQARRS
ncbi:MAG: class I SAM-dependent methyltransferase [Candidatus Andersenbacteria bacterium]|nr:class I SAM-dependent methyltransferase [Candidatus Andersenbacteria bacterium]